MSLLELKDVRKSFGAIDALRGVTFSVEAGSAVAVTAVLGPTLTTPTAATPAGAFRLVTVEPVACAVHAVELIVAAGRPSAATTAAQIDEILWNRGQAPQYKAVPRHRSRSTAY